MVASTVPISEQTHHPYVEQKAGVCGGKAVIAGTRIKVMQVAIEYERLGWTPDQIVDAHPHLTLAQVHDALSYYYENQVVLDEEIAADEQLVAELRRRYLVKTARRSIAGLPTTPGEPGWKRTTEVVTTNEERDFQIAATAEKSAIW